MGMKKQLGIIAAASMMFVQNSITINSSQPDSFVIETSKKRKQPKSKLTNKQKKVRAKNKMAKQSRKKNRR